MVGIKSYRARGRWYHYDRVSGARLIQAPGTPEFLAEVHAARAISLSLALPPGTLGAVIEQYKADETVWGILKPATQKSYSRAFVALDPIKKAPMCAMTRAAVIKLRKEVLFKKHGWWLANYAVTVLSVLFAFAYDNGIVTFNPLKEKITKLKKRPDAPKANRAWTAEELEVVFTEAPSHIGLPLAMAACLGLRFSDIMSAPLSSLQNGVAWLRTSKTGQVIKVPIHPVLEEALATRPKSDATEVCLNSNGKPWATGFNASWSKFRKKLETEGKIGKGLTIHGLRHTLGKMLKEAGLTDSEIADILGQASVAMARHYSSEAGLPAKSKETLLELNLPGKKANKAV